MPRAVCASLALAFALSTSVARAAIPPPPPSTASGLLPGMPAPLVANDIYAADRPGWLSPVVRDFPSRVYVPNSGSDTVDVIDPATYKVIAHYPSGGKEPQHVVPAYDLRSLWVINNWGSTASEISPATGVILRTISMEDPYNLYFTPDGQFAIVVAEREHELHFLDPETMKLRQRLSVPCRGIDHMDFTADGRYFIASCEFSGELLKFDVATHALVGDLKLPKGAMPQDVKTAPDGALLYVADMTANGVYEVSPDDFRVTGFIPTGRGTHGLYVSRDSRSLYISNRGEGSISVLDFATHKVRVTWHIPHGGSPDMGGVSADGKVLWLSGRYDHEVYAISTGDGHLLARIPVGNGPHGLCVYPQPGRYSLGHTGVFR